MNLDGLKHGRSVSYAQCDALVEILEASGSQTARTRGRCGRSFVSFPPNTTSLTACSVDRLLTLSYGLFEANPDPRELPACPLAFPSSRTEPSST